VFYTYILKNSLDDQPFYVGKGKGSRMYAHASEALRDSYKYKRSVHRKIVSIINKGGTIIYEQEFFDTEHEAFEREKQLITLYGRKDINTGILCNLTEGGEGARFTPLSIQQRAEKHRGMKRSEQAKLNMREAQLKIKEKNKQLYGKGCSPETSENMSKSRKGKQWSTAARQAKRRKPTARKILVYLKETMEFVGEWESISICAKELKCDHSAIWKICRGDWFSETPTGVSAPYKSHKGYIFKFKDQDNPSP